MHVSILIIIIVIGEMWREVGARCNYPDLERREWLLCCSAAPQQQQQQQSLETGAIVINAIIATASRADDCRVVQEGSLDIDIR